MPYKKLIANTKIAIAPGKVLLYSEKEIDIQNYLLTNLEGEYLLMIPDTKTLELLAKGLKMYFKSVGAKIDVIRMIYPNTVAGHNNIKKKHNNKYVNQIYKATRNEITLKNNIDGFIFTSKNPAKMLPLAAGIMYLPANSTPNNTKQQTILKCLKNIAEAIAMAKDDVDLFGKIIGDQLRLKGTGLR